MADVWYPYEMFQAFLLAPTYHLVLEFLLIVWIIRLIFTKSYKPHRTELSEKEKEDLIAEWTPEPLVPETPADHPALNARVIEGKPGKIVTLNGRKCYNMATLNFLNMIGQEVVENAAIQTLRVNGVGSCGPRGFYGTVDKHLDLEDRLAKFMGVEEAVLYSYGFPTIASVIPSYSKRGDVIFCDEGVCFAVQQGLKASRSVVKYFKHNDVDDLTRLLEEQTLLDKKNPKKAKVTRRFLVVEGLYMNYADICPLPELVKLKYKYKVRLFVEESLSFGVLGASGRGVTEHFSIPVEDVDLICASLENSVASIGGFCCGRSFIVDHQRLSGLGYCFSASLPPMLASAAICVLSLMQEDHTMFTRLEQRAAQLHAILNRIEGVNIVAVPVSPFKHLCLADSHISYAEQVHLLEQIVEKAEEEDVALVVARYLNDQEHLLPRPSIRVTVNNSLTEEELEKIGIVIKSSCERTLHTDLNSVE